MRKITQYVEKPIEDCLYYCSIMKNCRLTHKKCFTYAVPEDCPLPVCLKMPGDINVLPKEITHDVRIHFVSTCEDWEKNSYLMRVSVDDHNMTEVIVRIFDITCIENDIQFWSYIANCLGTVLTGWIDAEYELDYHDMVETLNSRYGCKLTVEPDAVYGDE